MINAEKYRDEILAKVDKTERFAIETNNQNVLRNCIDLECSECLFNEGTGLCYFERMKWLLSKYKKHIKLTRFEYEILKWLIDKDYKYIARDSGGGLYVYYEQPPKKDRIWGSAIGDHFSICDFRDLFHFVKWEDSTPTSIEYVLKNCEVVNDAEE